MGPQHNCVRCKAWHIHYTGCSLNSSGMCIKSGFPSQFDRILMLTPTFCSFGVAQKLYCLRNNAAIHSVWSIETPLHFQRFMALVFSLYSDPLFGNPPLQNKVKLVLAFCGGFGEGGKCTCVTDLKPYKSFDSKRGGGTCFPLWWEQAALCNPAGTAATAAEMRYPALQCLMGHWSRRSEAVSWKEGTIPGTAVHSAHGHHWSTQPGLG